MSFSLEFKLYTFEEISLLRLIYIVWCNLLLNVTVFYHMEWVEWGFMKVFRWCICNADKFVCVMCDITFQYVADTFYRL